MKKLNETSSAKINVLGDSELDEVVGGYGQRKRGGHGGGWYKPRYNGCKKYESKQPEYTEESSDYETDFSEPSATNSNAQVVNVAVAVNIAQVQT